jgi:DNA polymerase type B, organellar and viral
MSNLDLSDFAAFIASSKAEADATGPIEGGWQVCEPETDSQRTGRPRLGAKPLTQAEKNAKRASRIEAKQRSNNVAILDMETDDFDNTSRKIVRPFLAVFYSPRFTELNIPTDPKHPDCHIIWEENHGRLIERVLGFIEALPEKFTVYAHNGGKFDYMFLISKLRGTVSFKGRGIMRAMVAGCALRDSFLIIPQSLASIQKDDFDYGNMSRGKRGRFRDEITRYCVHDCKNLYPIIATFRERFGPAKLTIGQAALGELQKTCAIKRFNEGWDAYIRRYYYGGRVECLQGCGDFRGKWKIYDINSSYPNVMAHYQHPIGNFHDYTMRVGAVGEDTCFIDLECDNRGALIARDPETGETTANIPHGRFFTTIHEFEVATRYNLISNVEINLCLDCKDRTTFADFVLPWYERRQAIKNELAAMKARGGENSPAWFELTRDDIIHKLILNNAYGKTGQNPREFKDDYITDPGQKPPDSWFKSLEYIDDEEVRKLATVPHYMDGNYWIWQKPALNFNYLNVGVAASITGAARAVLLEAIQLARNPIYCDTDSLICEGLSDVRIDPSQLGAWHLEDTSSRVLIGGKKQYAVLHDSPKKRSAAQLRLGLDPNYTIKCKGVGNGLMTWQEMLDVVHGGTTLTTSRAPTLDRYGGQRYIARTIKATAEVRAR